MSPKLVMLNWRDPWHPKAGGAELVTLRVLERIHSRYGWQVEWFSSSYGGAKADETRHGIRYLRAGSELSVRYYAAQRYARSEDIAVLVDQINTIPFFSPLYRKAPVLLFMHQLAREVWWYEAPFPLSAIGYTLEPLLLRPYKNIPFITVSKSSLHSMRRIGLRGPAYVLPEAIDEPADVAPSESKTDDIIVVGRVAPSKRIEHSLRAAASLQALGWKGTLHVVGGGNDRYVTKLKRLAGRLSLANVRFHGRVDDAGRLALMRDARLLWMTSVREGWGLVVSEAGQHFTPAVAYNSPGLRDSIDNGVTGALVASEPSGLAAASWKILNDRRLWSELAHAAHEMSSSLSWDATGEAFCAAVMDVCSTWRA